MSRRTRKVRVVVTMTVDELTWAENYGDVGPAIPYGAKRHVADQLWKSPSAAEGAVTNIVVWGVNE